MGTVSPCTPLCVLYGSLLLHRTGSRRSGRGKGLLSCGHVFSGCEGSWSDGPLEASSVVGQQWSSYGATGPHSTVPLPTLGLPAPLSGCSNPPARAHSLLTGFPLGRRGGLPRAVHLPTLHTLTPGKLPLAAPLSVPSCFNSPLPTAAVQLAHGLIGTAHPAPERRGRASNPGLC